MQGFFESDLYLSHDRRLISIVDDEHPGKSLDVPAGSIVLHKSPPTYSCPECGESDTTEDTESESIVCDGEETSVVKYTCQDCGRSFWI